MEQNAALWRFSYAPQRFLDAVAAILKHELHRLLVDDIMYECISSTDPDVVWELLLFTNEERICSLTALLVPKWVYESRCVRVGGRARACLAIGSARRYQALCQTPEMVCD